MHKKNTLSSLLLKANFPHKCFTVSPYNDPFVSLTDNSDNNQVVNNLIMERDMLQSEVNQLKGIVSDCIYIK